MGLEVVDDDVFEAAIDLVVVGMDSGFVFRSNCLCRTCRQRC